MPRIKPKRFVKWLAAAAAAAILLPVGASEENFSSLPIKPVSGIKLLGKTLLVLQDGDYVFPSFSPDSSKLAYSRLVADKDMVLGEVHVLDLATRKPRVLLDARASSKYAVYGSYVSDFNWQADAKLEADILDGDVDMTRVSFDLSTGSIVGEKHFNMIDDPWQQRSDAATKEMVYAFPTIPIKVLLNAIQNGVKVSEKRYVVQKNYFGHDHHIWYLDAARREPVKLVDVPDKWLYSLRGAFAFEQEIVFLVAYGTDGYLLKYANGQLDLLQRFETDKHQRSALHVKHTTKDKVIFLVSTGHGGKPDNPTFIYNRSGLRQVADLPQLHDITVDNTGRLAGLILWNENKRSLVIKELNEPH